jgi:hypothetical protein
VDGDFEINGGTAAWLCVLKTFISILPIKILIEEKVQGSSSSGSETIDKIVAKNYNAIEEISKLNV